MRQMGRWLKRRYNYDDAIAWVGLSINIAARSLARSRNVGKYPLHIIFEQNQFPWQPRGNDAFLSVFRNLHAQMKLRSLLEFHNFFFSLFRGGLAMVLWIIIRAVALFSYADDDVRNIFFCAWSSSCWRSETDDWPKLETVWTFSASKLNNFSEILKQTEKKRYEKLLFYIRRKRSKSRNGKTLLQKISMARRRSKK